MHKTNASKSLEKFLGKTLVFSALVSIPLYSVGCCGSTIRDTGAALDSSYQLIYPHAEVALELRNTANDFPDMTIVEFLNENGLTPISDSDRQIMGQTLIEHRLTINSMINFEEE